MLFRPTFHFPEVLPSWHLGHMVKALKQMRMRLAKTDLMIEVRDARLPLTSINPVFGEMLRSDKKGIRPLTSAGPAHLIVYNKRDLAESGLEQPLRAAFAQHGQTVLFTNTRLDGDVHKVLQQTKELGNRKKRHDSQGIQIMICGMPNVGKSSLLNALRRVGCYKGKAAPEASVPGYTRSVGGMIKLADDPDSSNSVYAFDTPGIIPPYLGRGSVAADRAFKMALTAGIKDSLFDAYDLSAFLLHGLINRSRSLAHVSEAIASSLDLPSSFGLPTHALDPSEPLPTEYLLVFISERIRAVKSGGLPNLETAAQWFLKCYRDGKFGQWTLDDVGQDHSTFFSNSGGNSADASAPPNVDNCPTTSMLQTAHNNLKLRVLEKVAANLKFGQNSPLSNTAVKVGLRKAKKASQQIKSQMRKR